MIRPSPLIQYVKKDDTNVILTGDYMEIYIPDGFLKGNLASAIGDTFESFGLLEVMIKNGNKEFRTILNLPSMVTFTPSETDVVTIDEEKYTVMKFYKGDRIMRRYITKSSDLVQLYLYLILHGKIPEKIPYEHLLDTWEMNSEINGYQFKVASNIKEVTIAGMCRAKNDIAKRYGKVVGKTPATNLTDYVAITINEACATSNTVAAITFEDMDAMLISAINMNKYKQDEKETPLEKVMKM